MLARTHMAITFAGLFLFLPKIDFSLTTFFGVAFVATLLPDIDPKIFRIVKREKAKKGPVPTYIGVEPSTLPDNDQIISDLLSEFKEHRDAVMAMILDIEKLKAKIDSLIPDQLDSRYVRFFEEKVKTATEFFKTLLEMRKEIQKSLKDEIAVLDRKSVV